MKKFDKIKKLCYNFFRKIEKENNYAVIKRSKNLSF